MKRFFPGLLVLAVLFETSECTARQWSDVTGAYKVEAEFVRLAEGKVTLKKTDGSEVTVPLDKLSPDDQAFAKQQAALTPGVGPANTAGTPAAGPPAPGSNVLVELLDKQAMAQRTARESVLIYTRALLDPVNAPLRADIERKRTHWDELARKKSVRLADKWVAMEEAKAIEEEEQKLLQEAIRLLEVGNDKLAAERFRKASQVNPQGIASDFAMGLLYALFARQAEEAEKCFSLCVRRRQWCSGALRDAERINHVASLNNAALAKVRMGEYRAALVNWQQALDLAAPAREIVQNLGRLNELATAYPHLKVPDNVTRAAGDLYAKVAISSGAQKYDSSVGWLYMKFVSEPSFEQFYSAAPKPKETDPNAPNTKDPSATGRAGKEELELVGSGTGFSVGSHYLITNRHVVEKADAIKIAMAGQSDSFTPAKIVGLADRRDLAILKADSLDLPALNFKSGAPRLGSELIVTGFPIPSVLGQNIKASKGIVSGLPDAATDHILLYDAVTSPGNSGSPVCDKHGHVVAVHTLGLGGENIGRMGGGVPAEFAMQLLQAVTDDWKPAPVDSKELAWEQIVEDATNATVQILIFQRPEKIKFDKLLTSPVHAWNAYEDRHCMACYGVRMVACPGRGCGNGKVKTRSTEVLGQTANGRSLTKQKTSFVACGTCNGRGAVNCPFCP